MLMAITMGASGTAPSFSVAYGSNVVRKSIIPGLFGIMVFLGALIGGGETANTVGKGVLAPELMSSIIVSIILFSVAIALLIASLLGIPQSTSHTTILSVTAVALYYNSLNTEKLLLEIIPLWFVLPVISFLFCFFIGKYIYKPIRKKGYTMSKKVNESPILKWLILLMALYVSFTIGTNNVANAVGPIASMTINEMGLQMNNENYSLLILIATLIIAPCFGIGSSILGHKIVSKTGKELFLFGKIEAIIIAFVSGSLLLFASLSKGIPMSLVQLNVAAILGIGVAKLGFKNIFKKTEVNKFFAMWIISPVIAFSLSLILIILANYYGLLS